ncbi:MAG: hypothetical protein GTO02_01305 [Candidatus Dadabacteria bacterium]|nr:hypothetical protein [Candidatus Dadabacteria bacterium]
MFSYWFGTDAKDNVPELTDQEQKRLRYKMLIEITQFDKKVLLPTYKPVVEVKPKITKYKKTKRVKKVKK